MSRKIKSREYTKNEIREEFLAYVSELVTYWNQNKSAKNSISKLEGLAFSIMSAIDGVHCRLPIRFILAPDPHPTDKKFRVQNGENYYPENYKSKVKGDISGSLHDEYQFLQKD